MLNDQDILRHIERQPNQTAGFKQLVRELGLGGGNARRELHDHLTKLVRRGDLAVLPGDRWAMPAKRRGASDGGDGGRRPATPGRPTAVGRLSMHRDGFGFAIPESAELKGKISGDIFINPQAVGTAMHGDRVLVELGTIRPDGRAEGRILKVLDRAHDTVVGVFHYGPKNNFVTPIDEKLATDIVIPRGMEQPTRLQRDRVIGSEAKRTTAADAGDLEGVVVDVEITDWPTQTQGPRGRVVEILGREDDFGVDVEIIIRKHHIPHRFPEAVIAEAQAYDALIAPDERARRHDYRELPIVTIDGETARDFDDAVYVERVNDDNGNYRLHVHIADVAYFVREDTALDREARLRGNSVYFPDRAVPMLPTELSSDLCSLRPQVERLVMSCVMEVDPQGEVVSYELHEGIIRSAERMTYTNVQLILDGDAALRAHYAPLVANFELMRELAQILNRKRVRRGSIDFDLPEPQIEFDEQGMMESVTKSERQFAHRLIEEFMLAANECVASYLEARVASIYRVHEKPDPKKVYEFETIAASFGYSLGVGALPVRRMETRGDRRQRYGSGRSNPRMIELPQEVHITPRMYQKLTQKIAGKPEERILSYLMLRSLKQARYSEENLGHFALAAPTYTHFTSPIRRYPDLIIHRLLKAVLHGETAEVRTESRTKSHKKAPSGKGVPPHSEAPSPWSKRAGQTERSESAKPDIPEVVVPEVIPIGVLHEIAEESSQTERRADDAERELMEWKKIRFMRDRLGEEFEGLIVSVTKFGLFVELMDMFIEGLVPLATMTDDRYTYRENTKQIVGERGGRQYSLGQRVRVIVDRIDYVQHKIQFALAEEELPRAKKRHKQRR
ncbi:MAG: VacB/RNase II family 3'-5' exoribonuclease [Acidobacteriota bacterium]|nr:VacB/RNase II family 3'-5' exoribonuclease [Acidobacteriota bacterium]